LSERPPLLVADGVTVRLTSAVPIVEDATVHLAEGEILGVVGESGSGKTTLALALLGFVRPGARITSGQIMIDGQALHGRTEQELRELRGRLISYVPQDPATALNPARRVGRQILDRISHRPKSERPQLVRRALERAQLPSDEGFVKRFPHQLSGGQQQRVLIAMALVGEPSVIVLDEPTTGLDVVTQARLLNEIRRLRDELGSTLVYVSHDISAVASVADSISVMYAGRIVEQGPIDQVLRRPVHPYTVGLLQSVPDHTATARLQGLSGIAVGIGDWPAGCPFAPRCHQKVAVCEQRMPMFEESSPGHKVRCFEWRSTPRPHRTPVLETRLHAEGSAVLAVEALRAIHRTPAEDVIAADGVSFDVHAGECVALVGESGSGKTTIARCLAGLHPPIGGTIRLHGQLLAGLAGQRDRQARRQLQIVFQNPYDSLNPRHRVKDAVGRVAVLLGGLSGNEAQDAVIAALAQVRLSPRVADRFPGELSGGERQRVAIARALVARPELLICDEITSSLDVSVQAAVLDLLDDLRSDLGLAILLITHDLGVVSSAANRVLVLEQGVICEAGPVRTVLAEPEHAYTRKLVAAAPHLDLELDVV
jgi:peptide/nickel transport system ATP-binding protein